LNRSSFLKPRSFTVALQHHEAYDGSGYPSGKKGEEIHIFSRLATVVDVFDALTTDRPYKPRWSFHKAISFMKGKIASKLDPAIFELFQKYTLEYPPGATVLLSSGEIGVVVSNLLNHPSDPKVRIIRDSQGKELDKKSAFDLNLGENKEVRIVCPLEDKSLD